MGLTEGFDDDIPAVMISKDDGAALRASGATSVTVDDEFSEFITDNGDILAGFSSQGPTFVDYALKPDLTSVGVNVLSSEACDTTGACGNDGCTICRDNISRAARDYTSRDSLIEQVFRIIYSICPFLLLVLATQQATHRLQFILLVRSELF